MTAQATRDRIFVRDLSFVRGSGSRVKPIFRQFGTDFPSGEIAAVLGVSGCGKTTLLKLLSNQLPLPGNSVVELNGLTPSAACQQRSMYNLPQGFRPPFWLNARQSVMLPLKLSNQVLTEDELALRVGELMNAFEISDFSDRRPHELSGGQARRISLAMAFACKPKYLLLDEPFTGLDSIARIQLYRYLLEYIDRVQTNQISLRNCIVVTHDVQEAALIADRVFIFQESPAEKLVSFPNPIQRKDRIASLRELQFSDQMRPFLRRILACLPKTSLG